MAAHKTSLSAGIAIRTMLMQSEAVTKHTSTIYPVLTDKAELPYILYRKSALEHTPTKSGYQGADTAQIEVVCYAAKYADSVEMAEAVREALDYQAGEFDGVKVRGCMLSDCEDLYEAGAYVQRLIFSVKI